jgi:hypothetical protein
MLTDKAEGDDAQPAEKPGDERSARTKNSQTIKPKPRTRAGKIQAEKVPLTITWGQKMLFYGRSVDPENRPSAKALFYKNVIAEMEDGLLSCKDVMTTYTDQPVPLADLGKMSHSGHQPQGRSRPAGLTQQAADYRRPPDLRPPDRQFSGPRSRRRLSSRSGRQRRDTAGTERCQPGRRQPHSPARVREARRSTRRQEQASGPDPDPDQVHERDERPPGHG